MGRHSSRGGNHRAPAPPAGKARPGRLALIAAGALLAAGWHLLAGGPQPVAVAGVRPASAAERWAGRKPPPPPPPVRVVEPAARVEPGRAAAQAALSKRGVLYLWGSKGPDRFDCSGLTQWAWKQVGVRLGEDTYTQVVQGRAVPAGAVQAGDLIFPSRSFNQRGPGHVLLAVSSTQAVEAPARGMPVRVVPLPPSYVARRPG